MKLRPAAALFAVLALEWTPVPAARASTWAAVASPDPAPGGAASVPEHPGAGPAPDSPAMFPRVPLRDTTPSTPHRGAYATMAGGAALVGFSFTLRDHANQAYADYLAATDPDRITALYDRAAHDDHLASAALLGGEALFAAGLWMRFLHRPRAHPVTLLATPGRCALALRF